MPEPVREVACPFCENHSPDSADTCRSCGHVLHGTFAVRRGTLLANRYQILEFLGMGGMGAVYKARDRALDEVVAVKLLRSELVGHAEHSRRFRSEIKLARKISHRNVCRIFEYGEDACGRFIAMELVQGTDLRQVVRQSGGLSPDEAFDVAIQAALGLEAIHEAGVVHRDLKTPNIMRDARGVVKLMDFGIAKDVRAGVGGQSTPGTATGLIVGTPEYMSPEQARGDKIDQRSDIYALGIVTYELFVGVVPFRAETPLAVILKHVNEPPPLDDGDSERLPPAILPVLRRALAKDPGERYPDAGAMAAALLEAHDAWLAAGALGRRAAVLGSLPTPRPAHTLATLASRRGRLSTPTPRASGGIATGTLDVATPVAQRVVAPRAGRRRLRLALFAGVACSLLLGILALRYLGGARGRQSGTVSESISPTASTAELRDAAQAAQLFVTINALPWARVRLVSDRGLTVTPASTVTPCALLLPAGAYTLHLDNGGLTPGLEQAIRVEAGTPNVFVFSMPGFDPERVVSELGLR